MSLSAINRRIIPPYLVATPEWAVWVDGYTSDEPTDWVLMMGFRNYRGDIAPGTIEALRPNIIWRGTPRESALPTDIEMKVLTKMIGNTQRALRGIPAVS